MLKSPARLHGHEPAMIAVAPILKIAGSLFISVALIAAVLYLLLRFAVMPHQAQVAARQGTLPPPPRLQVHASDDLRELRLQKQALLEDYQWLDPAHTAARVPIERAMQIYARQSTARRSASEQR